ncbi:MAG: ABC transporter ATP-binding protein [Bacilli bacterium]|nr:ABC transporter ATP-binding protein [Bacilli bacterium]MBR1582034.1 ABC transporter ATP-binding protein [Bacilli bacterium]
MKENIVEFKNISIDYPMKKYTLRAVNNVSLNVKRGKITALVGESGSGKTTLSSSLIRCISEPGIIAEGEVIFNSNDGSLINVEKLKEKELRSFRWEKVSMVFQAAQSALNPVLTVRQQFYETLDEHGIKLTKEEKEAKCLKILDFVKLDSKRVIDCYPHELSGGMKQRVMIAFSLLLDPEVIILDEPTTALDVITQHYIFNLLKEINKTMNISMLLMTHDISVVASFADYIAVMYGGRVMEYGSVEEVFKNKLHPYTKGLINATPSIIGNIDDVRPIDGRPPNMLDLPKGCVFSDRCPFAKDICKEKEPETLYKEDGSFIKCHLFLGGEDNGK